MRCLLTFAVVLLAAPAHAADAPARLAQVYANAIQRINKAHAAKPGKNTEAKLAKRLPRTASQALDRLVRLRPGPGVAEALVECGEAALELDRLADFERIRKRLLAVAPDDAAKLGIALSRPRFLARGLGGFEPAGLRRVADVFDAVLTAYDAVFGFKEWSKVPGKKLRLRLRLVPRITSAPHFAPEFPFHSEIDFPLIDPKAFTSPTRNGQFLFYGLCHELGHVIAMWGNRRLQEDHHAWAHYTGIVIVEHLVRTRGSDPVMKGLKDLRWRSPEVERKRLGDRAPSVADRDGVLSLLLSLHDRVGPNALGAAINLLDKQDKRLRINRVRYYTFAQLKAGLMATLRDAGKKRAVASLLP